MMTNAKIGTALVGGYLLGRTKKAKLALGLGMFLAGKKLSLDPDAIKKAVAQSPVLGELNSQVREQILGATKTAAKGALTKRVSGLADTLRERTLSLEGGAGGEQDEAAGEAEQDRAARGDDEDETQAEDAPARKTGRRAGSGTGKARKSTAPARKTASGGGKPAARTAGKASGAARKTASRPGSSRRTSGGGDDNV
jgi:hypothetical protein